MFFWPTRLRLNILTHQFNLLFDTLFSWPRPSAAVLRETSLLFWLANCFCFLGCEVGAAQTAQLNALAVETTPTLMRFPQVHGHQLVFVARGNLWTVARTGGRAHRLTNHPGQDLAPRFSPDGRWVAFTSNFRGDEQVYVVPTIGGTPRQLTFRSAGSGSTLAGKKPDNLVLTWTPDSKHIVFASASMAWNAWGYRPFQVPVGGGLPVPLPLDQAGLLTYGPIPHTIVYASSFRDFDARKRYQGGLAPDLYTYNLQTHRRQRLTTWRGTDTAPMWWGKFIYFQSDRDSLRRANLWVLNPATGRTRAVTHFRDYDLDFPSLGSDAIAFQQGGQLYVLDLPSERLHAVPVQVPDDGSRTAPRLVDAARTIRLTDNARQPDYTLSPTGGQAAFAARGDVWVVPTDTGTPRNLTQSSMADEEHPAWSPDGATLAYVTDGSGEQQIAVRSPGGGPERLLTHFAAGYFYKPRWSPDSRLLAVPDGAHRLWLVALAGGEPRLVAQDPHAEIQDASFSPDGRWLAFSQEQPNRQRGLYCYELATGRTTALSAPLNNDTDPVFSLDGRYLYYRSNRHELPAVSSSETNFATLKADGLYVATLQATALSPFAPGAAAAPGASDPEASPLAVDLVGLLARSVPLPIAPGDLGAVVATKGGVFYQSHPSGLIGGELPGEVTALHLFTLASQQDRVVASGFDHGVLSTDGRHLLCRKAGAWQLVATASDSKEKEVVLSLTGMQTLVNPRQEWENMFAAAWRLERDLFFNLPTLTANDWAGLRAHYARLLPLLGSREDARYLTGQLLGELGSSHVFVSGGDAEGVPVAPVLPLLGVDFELDAQSGRYQLAKIYAGDNSRPAYRSPLTEPGLGVRAGDYLLAVNGHALRAPQNPYELFVSLSGPLTLRLAASATGPAHDIVVQPLTSETAVREQDWVAHSRAQVDQLSGGRVGYIYLGDFHRLGAEQFVRQYYPQLDKQALIVDVRWNVGGYTSQLILERLRRRPVGAFVNREQAVSVLPGQAAPGALVTITNEFSGSDGDQFPYYFQQYGLGKVVGTRTWGGVRGLGGAWRLLDGGFVTAPKDALISTKGQWQLENEGATPDLEVANEPGDYLQGTDRQLVAAWQVLAPRMHLQPITPLRLAPQSAYPPAGEVPPARVP